MIIVLSIALFISIFINYILLRYTWFILAYSFYVKLADFYISQSNIDDLEEIEYFYQVWPTKNIIFSFSFKLGNFFYYPEYYNNVINYYKIKQNENKS
jgi:hypothetical protein